MLMDLNQNFSSSHMAHDCHGNQLVGVRTASLIPSDFGDAFMPIDHPST